MTIWKLLKLKNNEKIMKRCHSSITFRSFRSLFEKTRRTEPVNALNEMMRDVSSNHNILRYTIKDLRSIYPALEEYCKTEADKQSLRRIVSFLIADICFSLFHELKSYCICLLLKRIQEKKIKRNIIQ